MKMNNFEEDIRKYREELKELKADQIKYQRTMKKKQEDLVLIFHQYRDVCNQAGISGSLNFTRSGNQNKMTE